MHTFFKPLFLLPSPSGRGAGGEGLYAQCKKRHCLQFNTLSPHPNPLPEGEETCVHTLARREREFNVALLPQHPIKGT